MVIGCTAMLLITSAKLSLISVLVLPPGGIIAVYMGRFMKKKQSEVRAMTPAKNNKNHEITCPLH
jgi:hypothetical protein